jgi:hypothetical protein
MTANYGDAAATLPLHGRPIHEQLARFEAGRARIDQHGVVVTLATQ